MRGFKFKKAVQAVNYFATKCGGKINKMKALKLIWLSDRLHIRRYGRTITEDEYYAMPNGPVPSATRDVMEFSSFIDDFALDYSSEYLKKSKSYDLETNSHPNLCVFSKTDIDVMNEFFDVFGHRDHFDLSEFSHLFPEWKKYESAITKRLSSRFPISQLDFFINVNEPSHLFVDSEENLNVAKLIFENNQKSNNLLI